MTGQTESRADAGFTVIELLMVVAIISITAAIAIPGFLRAKMAGNESSAITSLRIVTSSEIAYSASCGQGGYAASFVVLGTAPPGSGPFISKDLGSAVAPVKSGYNMTLGGGVGSVAGPNDCNATATVTNFYSSGVPVTFGRTGTRSFATNTANTIWQSYTGIAPAEPFASPAKTIQ